MKGPQCSQWARSTGVDPIGTAGVASGYLLVDWPLPWPRDAGDIEALAPARDALAGTGFRLQLVVPAQSASTRTVVLYRSPEENGWFAGYERIVRIVEPSEVAAAAMELIKSGMTNAELGRDVLVFGHGARDRCCGSLGTALALHAIARGLPVRRTSHTGGHRFAPTALVLPDGTSWAFLDDNALDRVVDRRGTLDDLLPRYRGCASIGGPLAQAAERVAFGEVGWAWLEYRRRAVDLGNGLVRIDAVGPDGTEHYWVVQVELGRLLPVPECGQPPENAPKHEAELIARRA
jgi:hypothetical protein